MAETSFTQTIQVRQSLHKTKLFDTYKPKASLRKLFDEQISKMTIVGEISQETTNLSPGENVSSIFMVQIALKSSECSSKNIEFLVNSIKQSMVFILQYEADAMLAASFKERVIFSKWMPRTALNLRMKGHDLDAVWLNFLNSIADSTASSIEELDEMLLRQEKIDKLEKRIKVLDQKTMKETQPKRKWALHEQKKQLDKELEEIQNG